MSGKTGGTRRRNVGVKGKRPDLKVFRVKEASERLVVWQALSVTDQLAALNVRLGKDVGAKRQRARLLKKLAV